MRIIGFDPSLSPDSEARKVEPCSLPLTPDLGDFLPRDGGCGTPTAPTGPWALGSREPPVRDVARSPYGF
ncbi:unnamed protein product, partial [Nesidiocoris tenuis]